MKPVKKIDPRMKHVSVVVVCCMNEQRATRKPKKAMLILLH